YHEKAHLKIFLRGGCGGQRVMDILDPLEQVLDSSTQSTNLYQHPCPLAFHVFAPMASLGAQASDLLRPLPHLSSFAPQPSHFLLPPLGSHGMEFCYEHGSKVPDT
uniref:Uncharacterized protein n=1 Tax=Equus asinus TaxID=9793 RepID=A0A9L0JXG5_EQUAS